MPFLIGLVFPQRRCPFSPLFLPLAATQPGLATRGHQVDKHARDNPAEPGFDGDTCRCSPVGTAVGGLPSVLPGVNRRHPLHRRHPV